MEHFFNTFKRCFILAHAMADLWGVRYYNSASVVSPEKIAFKFAYNISLLPVEKCYNVRKLEPWLGRPLHN